MQYIFNGTLLSIKWEGNIIACNTREKHAEHYAKWNKPNIEELLSPVMWGK